MQGPTPFFLHSKIFLNEISTKFCFFGYPTKSKACITHYTAILTLTGTFLTFKACSSYSTAILTLADTFLSFLTVTVKQSVRKWGWVHLPCAGIQNTAQKYLCVGCVYPMATGGPSSCHGCLRLHL